MTNPGKDFILESARCWIVPNPGNCRILDKAKSWKPNHSRLLPHPGNCQIPNDDRSWEKPNPGRGVKHWDKCKFRTALARVVFTSSRIARLEYTKALDAGKNWK